MTVHAEEWITYKDNIATITPAPSLKFPNQIGVLRAKIYNPKHPYMSVGYFFKKGDLFKDEALSAQDYKQNPIQVQIKPMNHYKDGSIRFALLTFKFDKPLKDNLYKVALLNKSPTKQNTQKVDFTLPDFKIKITTDQKRSRIISLNRKTAMERALWRKGPLLYEKRYFFPISTDLIAEFDVSFFDNGHKKINIALKHTAPDAAKTLRYKTEFLYKGKIIKNNALEEHKPHTIKRYHFALGYAQDNHPILDMENLITLGILPAYDIKTGINKNATLTDIRQNQSLIGQTDTNYLMVQSTALKKAMRINANKANDFPLYFTDMQNQKFIASKDFYKAKPDIKKTYPVTGYIPFIITAERQYYDHLKAHYVYRRLKLYKKMKQDPKSITLKDYISLRQSTAFLYAAHYQEDRYLSLEQTIKEDWSFINNNLMTYAMIGKDRYSLGELTGILPFKHHPEKDFLNIRDQDLLALITGFEANLNIFPQLKAFSNWQTQFISERFLQKDNVFQPFYGFASYFKIKEKDDYFRKWKDLAAASYKTQYFESIKNAVTQNSLSYESKYAMLLAAASNAQLYNSTGNIKALEAFGVIASFFPKIKQDILDHPHLRITPFIDKRKALQYSHIIIGQKYNDNFMNSKADSLIHGGAGNDIISVVSGAAYMFGGKGNDKLIAGTSDSVLFGGEGKDLLVAGTGNDILQGDSKNKLYPDIFKFDGSFIGQNTILDFTPGVDKIHISPKLNIAQYHYSNRLEGLSFDRRKGGKGRDPKCDKLTQDEQDKREECLKYRRYYNAGLVPFEYIKELTPDIQGFIRQEKERLVKSIKLLENDPTSRRYKRAVFEYKRLIEQEKSVNSETAVRAELGQLSKVTDIKEYREKENELIDILATKNVMINNILAASRFGDRKATALLNPKPITNIGLRNYFRPAAGSSTIIDFNINVTPEEHLKNSNDPISNRIGSILVKGIPPEKLTRENFIFGY